MDQTPRLQLDEQLCFSLYAATNAVTRAYRPLLGDLGLTYPQYLVMLALWQDGPSTIGSLARRLGLPPNALTPLLTRMEEAQWVRRRRDGTDRRVIHIELTERGVRLRDAAAEAQADVECRTGLERERLVALREELFALVRRMEGADALRADARETERA